jgi:nicotinate-nucleotide pyrophosphorylase
MFISQNQLDYRGSAQPKAQKIMAAKTKAEEDICEEAIILEVENQNLKHLIEQGVECISYDNMSLSEKKKFDTQKRIEELELDGVARVFSGNEDFRKHVWNC